MNLIEASSRIALTAFLHDLGKVAERAGIDHGGTLDAHKTLYCPFRKEGGYHTHVHAAYTGLGWDALEATGHFPDLRQGGAPFADGGDSNRTDSAVNAASAHHVPDTFLQWIVATADRVASGFERDKFDTEYNNLRERDNHYCARLLTLFEQLDKTKVAEGELKWRHPLQALSANSIFPQPAEQCTPRDNAAAKAQYHLLWDALLQEIRKIPKSHKANLALWLDHFDSLWLTITHAVPSATAFGIKPEVSLYDHSKVAAALATALWRWHHDAGSENATAVREGWDEQKFLLIQGDFFGIQDFIFAEGGDTQKHAHKLLRGRSFQVSLLAETAALRVLDELQLPSTSQIVNAAGKFLIVAPNTQAAREAIERCRVALDAWCLKHTYGDIGVGVACTPASCSDFAAGRFGDLIRRLFDALDDAKHQRFDLCADFATASFDGFLDSFDNNLGVCRINGKHPADPETTAARGYAISRLAHDQISIGEALTRRARLLIVRESATLPTLGLDYFGYRAAFVADEPDSGKYGELVRDGSLLRAWDFDAPEADGRIWRGYARRFVNGYVPRFDAEDQAVSDKYGKWAAEAEFDRQSPIKTLHHIACEDKRLLENGKWRGEVATVAVKGDIDNLGALFQRGLEKPTFAKMASLSRQVNAFFAIWLPWFCEHGKDEHGIARYRNTYTVFAGGDDFFLIGPWESTLALAAAMRLRFTDYVAQNDAVTFSAGMVMTHPKTPVRHLARSAEQALDAAKAHTRNGAAKNAVSLWNCVVAWDDWHLLMGKHRGALEDLMRQADRHGAGFSTSLTYSLLQLSDRSASRRPEDALWRSQLHYRLARFFGDRVKGDDGARSRREAIVKAAIAEIGGALGTYRGSYRLPLSVLLYQQRD